MSVSASVPQRLVDSVEESPVAAYVKDVDGRFLHVSQCYRKFFEVELDEVRGRTDDELALEQTIDGPRRAAGNVTENEPLQLEYTVPPFDGRPALAVWRFAVRTPEGDLVAVCGVAAPVAGSPLARRECDRLMAVTQGTEDAEREAAAEVDNAPTDGERNAERERRAEAEARAVEGDELRRRSEAAEAALLVERSRADESVAELNAALAELASVRGRLEGVESAAQAELDATRADLQSANAELASERARADTALERIRSEQGRAEQAEAALGAERAELEVARTELDSTRGTLGEAEKTAQRERLRADEAVAALNATRAELEAAQAELTSEREQKNHTEEEVVGELRRRLEEANGELAAERSRAEQAAASLRATRAELEAAQAQLASEREQHARNEADVVDDLRQRLARGEATAQQERERADAAEASVISQRADAEVRLGVAERRIAELEASLANARAHELEATSEHAASGPRWDSSAQRAFTTALAQSSDWRAGVKSAIGVIGALGGWDAVCAWQPDDRNGFASCFAMWTGENRPLNSLETATWQRRQPLTESTIGEALNWKESQWLAADPRAADRRLQLLAQHGIRGALIVPVKDGVRPVAALELLTVGANEPSRELVDAIETMALQLGHFSHLLSAGAQPHWRFGRA